MCAASIKHKFHYVLFQLDGDAELTECDSIHQLCLSWDLPAPNATNRKWLYGKLLLHAVMSTSIYSALAFAEHTRVLSLGNTV